jgi:hypothetical protein
VGSGKGNKGAIDLEQNLTCLAMCCFLVGWKVGPFLWQRPGDSLHGVHELTSFRSSSPREGGLGR